MFFCCKAHIHMYNVTVCFVHAICMFIICSVHQTHGFKFRLIRNGMDFLFNMYFKDHYQVSNWHFRSFKVIQIYTIFYLTLGKQLMVISKFDIVPLQLKSLNGGHIFLNLFNSIDLQKLQQYFYAYIFDICTS